MRHLYSLSIFCACYCGDVFRCQTQKLCSLLHAITTVQRDSRCGSIRLDPLTVHAVPRPLHLHLNASSLTYYHTRPNQSSVFRVKYSSFVQMVREQPQVIQDIFRDRHILVYGCDSIEDYDRLENDTYHRDIEHPAIEGQGAFSFLFPTLITPNPWVEGSYVMNVAGEGLRAGMSDFRPIEHKQTSTSLGDRPFQPDGIPGMR